MADRIPTSWHLPAVLCILAAGCANYRAPFKPPGGLIYTGIKAPLTVDFHQTPVRATSGESSSFYFREPIFTNADFAWNECDIATCARRAGLSSVDFAEYEYRHILGVFGWMRVQAYGPKEPSP